MDNGGPEHSHSTGTGACSEHWATIAAALDWNTKAVESLKEQVKESLLRCTIQTGPGPVMSTPTQLTGKEGGQEFRVHTASCCAKGPTELGC